MKKLFSIALLLSFFTAGSANAAIIFSDNWDTEPADELNGTLNNWTVSDGTVDIIGTGGSFDFLPGNGSYIDTDGSSSNAGKITTTSSFTFTLGQLYLLEFDLAGNQRRAVDDTVNFSVGGLLLGSVTLSATTPFTNFMFAFVGDGSTAALSFEGLGGDDVGLLLDDVVLSSVDPHTVPEPASCLLLGIGALGLTRLRRRN